MSSVGTRIWNLIPSFVIDLPLVKLKACSSLCLSIHGNLFDPVMNSRPNVWIWSWSLQLSTLACSKRENLATSVPQGTLLFCLFIHSINRVECLLDAGHHKRIFAYKNGLKEPLIDWGRLCSKEITFRFSLMEFIDWMNNSMDFPQISLNLPSSRL